jgi:hypothetical protein
MPTLFKFFSVVGLIGGIVVGGLYAMSIYFEPVPRETASVVPGVKVRK